VARRHAYAVVVFRIAGALSGSHDAIHWTVAYIVFVSFFLIIGAIAAVATFLV